MWIRILALGLGLSATTMGCLSGGIRVVKHGEAGGELALVGNMPSKAWEKAYAHMEAQCAQGYDIVEQGEEVVGQETVTSTNERVSKDGRRAYGTATTTTQEKTEWRVKYRCREKNSSDSASAVGTLREVLVTL